MLEFFVMNQPGNSENRMSMGKKSIAKMLNIMETTMKIRALERGLLNLLMYPQIPISVAGATTHCNRIYNPLKMKENPKVSIEKKIAEPTFKINAVKIEKINKLEKL